MADLRDSGTRPFASVRPTADWVSLAATAVTSDWAKDRMRALTASEAGRAARGDDGGKRLRSATTFAERADAGREELLHAWLRQRDHSRLTFDLSGLPKAGPLEGMVRRHRAAGAPYSNEVGSSMYLFKNSSRDSAISFGSPPSKKSM